MLEFLSRALEEFHANPNAARIMRRLASHRPNAFLSSAVRLLREAPAGPGRRHLTAILLNDPDIVARITHRRELSRFEIALIFQRMMEVNPLMDVRLARELPDRYGQHRSLDRSACAQMIDILDQISPGRRLIHMIGYLSEHPDPEIAAKATLLVARRIQSYDWIRRHIVVDDPRIRANTVEGLWGSKQSFAFNTYNECVHDKDNRVVGNALFGLHLAGDDRVFARALAMAHDNRPAFRWTAAWIMGQISDPGHVDPLHHLVRDDTPGVRRAALRSLITIRKLGRLKPAAQEFGEQPAAVELQPAPETNAQSSSHPWHSPGLRLDGRAFSSRKRD